MKDFTDYLISSNIADHSTALFENDKKATDLDFSLPLTNEFQSYNIMMAIGLIQNQFFFFMDGSIHSVSEAPSKILGHLLPVTPSQSRAAFAKKLESKLLTAQLQTLTRDYVNMLTLF